MTYSNHPMAQQYRAYATASATVGKTRQIVMLYDGVMRMIKKAVEAIGQEDWETRYNMLAKASDVILGLQNSLDYENGGELAQLLHDYYSSIDARLFAVHRSNDVAVCESILKELNMMRNVWDEIDKKGSHQPQAEASSADEEQTEESGHVPAQPRHEAAGVGISA